MKVLKVTAVACLGMLSTTALASSNTGYVTKTAYTGSRMFVWLDGTPDGASCNTPGAGQRYEIDGSNALGQAQMAFILTAQASHKNVYISGTNGCPIDTETIGYLEVRP